MTCVVGIARGRHVALGGDASIAWDEGTSDECREPKVWRHGDYLIGLAGDANADRAFRYELRLPKPVHPVRKLMTVDVSDEVRRAMAVSGAAEANFSALFGVFGQLYIMGSMFEVASHSYGYAAIGSGSICANGALFALHKDRGMTLEQILTVALEASACHCDSVRPKFVTLSA